MVIGESSKLPENHDLIQQLTDTTYRLEANAAEIEERAAKREAKRDEEMKKIIQQNNYLHETINIMAAKVAETKAKAAVREERAAKRESKINEEMKQMKQEINEVITDLSAAMHRLVEKFAEMEIKKNEEAKQIIKENSKIIAKLKHKVLKQVADIDLLNVQFTEFRQQQGKHHYNLIFYLINMIYL